MERAASPNGLGEAGVDVLIFGGVEDGQNAPRGVQIGGIVAAHVVGQIVEVDFPENAVRLASTFKFKRPECVIAVRVIVLGKL